MGAPGGLRQTRSPAHRMDTACGFSSSLQNTGGEQALRAAPETFLAPCGDFDLTQVSVCHSVSNSS